MDNTDLKFLLELVDRRIQRSTPMALEYWRGYRQGIKEYFLHMVDEPAPERSREPIDEDPGDPESEAYATGYCDGLKGRLN